MIELLAVVVVIVSLVAMVPPVVSAAREAARRAQCVNSLKQLGRALHSYHAAHESFPPMRCGTGASTPAGANPLVPIILPNSNGDQLSGFVLLLPYLEQSSLYLQIVNGDGTPPAPRWGPTPDPDVNAAWHNYTVQVTQLLCHSDDGARRYRLTEYARTNYAFCLGDSISNNDWVVPEPVTGTGNFKPPRGIFGWHTGTRIADVSDGTSNTIAMSERCICLDQLRRKGGTIPATVDENYAPATCAAYAGVGGLLVTDGATAAVTGLCWANGHACFVGFTTCLPPNAPSCGLTTVPARYAKGGSGGIYTPSSYHPGGVNCAFADGSVRFIADNIDTGDLNLSEAAPTPNAPNGQTSASPSRWGVWGALGSKASGEKVGGF